MDNDIEAIIQAGKDIMEGKEGTFKVIAKRANKNFEISSDKVNRMVASEI